MILNTLNNIDRAGHLSVSSSHTLNICGLHSHLDDLSQRQQWIMFTAQCPRQEVLTLAANKSWSNKVIHIMPSRQLSEFAVIEKAIRSGNASAIVASDQFSFEQQNWLSALAQLHQCQLFFVDTASFVLH